MAFLVGAVFLMVGMILFSLGVEMSMTPMGEGVGVRISHARRRGLGRRLYGALMELLTMQGVLTAHALVTSPNPASEALHGSMGFSLTAVQRLAGYKNGAWHDVVWFEKQIAPYDVPPAPVRPVAEIGESAEKVLQKYFGDARPDIQK